MAVALASICSWIHLTSMSQLQGAMVNPIVSTTGGDNFNFSYARLTLEVGRSLI